MLSACAAPAPEAGLELAIEGPMIDGSFAQAGRTLTFHASPLGEGEGAQVALDIDGQRLDLVFDQTQQLLTEDGHGATFSLADRELLLALRDHLTYRAPDIAESLPGRLLVRTADRYAEVPVGRARVRRETRLNAPVQEGKPDIATGGCIDDGVTCLDGTYGSSWVLFTAGGECQTFLADYGDSSCRGRCGYGCNWFDEDYTWDCHDHDVCLDYSSDCSDEFDEAADDWIATSAPYCWSGTDRSKPATVPKCGNGTVEPGEECDGGGGCLPDCKKMDSRLIVNMHSAKCLDVGQASQDDATAVTLWTCHGNPNQQWTFVPFDDGSVKVVAGHSGKCLTVANASTANGTPIQQWACVDGVAEQKWQVKWFGDNFGLISQLSGKCVDVAGWGTSDGTVVQQWDCHFSTNQRFHRP